MKAFPGLPPSEEVNLSLMIQSLQATKFEGNLSWFRNEWLLFDDGSPKLIPIGEVERWKSEKSQELLKQAQSMTGDPDRRIVLLRVAAKLGNVPLKSIMDKIESARKSKNERLEDLFQRIKNK